MKCYINEINKLRKENMEINEKIDILEREKDMILNEYYKSLKYYLNRIEFGPAVEFNGLTNKEIVILNRYSDIISDIGILRETCYQNEKCIKHLREEYKKLHMEEYHRSMDETDIRDAINRDGFIIAVKF